MEFLRSKSEVDSKAKKEGRLGTEVQGWPESSAGDAANGEGRETSSKARLEGSKRRRKPKLDHKAEPRKPAVGAS